MNQSLEAKSAGRPSLYKPEYCDQLIDHMSKGFSFESFAGIASVNPDTLYEWAKKHDSFSEAKSLGWAKSLLFFENEALEVAAGNKKAFSTTMLVFIMKCRFRKIYNDIAEDKDKELTIKVVRDNPKNDGDSDIDTNPS